MTTVRAIALAMAVGAGAAAGVSVLPAGRAAAEQVLQVPATSAPSATLRVLDKITGDTTDLEIGRGQTRMVGRLQIVLGDCRFPTNNPNSDAYAWLEIRDDSLTGTVFSGWMVASSPALSALDHPRYDVWVLRCNNS
ncbi:DUF2155 domain-containing protein [Tropicimonas sp. IMCC34043]|uniref:DUF2155 domain-containing protein n=1 Tax=Tropicimonas sp. IMCC34043 TaxID=2248760 RepID=UPI001E3915E4|nr:DUF2155 domain-containing protein [Tropicimonas sp. IMCC34043]